MRTILSILGIVLCVTIGCSQNSTDKKNSGQISTKFNKLTAEEEAVIVNKATERPFKIGRAHV